METVDGPYLSLHEYLHMLTNDDIEVFRQGIEIVHTGTWDKDKEDAGKVITMCVIIYAMILMVGGAIRLPPDVQEFCRAASYELQGLQSETEAQSFAWLEARANAASMLKQVAERSAAVVEMWNTSNV